jgi:hypothetical protein
MANANPNPWENLSTRELSMKSKDRACNFFLEYIEGTGKTEKIAHFIDEKLAITPKQYTSADEFLEDNPGYVQDIWRHLTQPQRDAIKQYTGVDPNSGFSAVNCVARGFWDFEKLGPQGNRESRIKKRIDLIAEAIPLVSPAKQDYIVFRGDNLDGFKSFGVFNLQDLQKMKGQFYLDEGFHSTALLQEKSFATDKTSTLWIGKSNIEIEIQIPKDSRDSIALLTEDLSYSPELTEVLLNRRTLCYISEVEVSGQEAKMKMLVIPRDLYDSPNQ